MALGQVVNFEVPAVRADYTHGVGLPARAAATGEAFTLVAPEDESNFACIERAVGTTIPRASLAGFAYEASAQEALEVPIRERIAVIRARKAADRARSAAKADRKSRGESAPSSSRPRRRRFGRVR